MNPSRFWPALALLLLLGGLLIPGRSPALAAPVLLSQGKPASASTVWAGNSAAFAVDGNPGTRWESAHSDPQWLQVDLGASHALSRAVLTWEAAHATAYQIQISNDGSAWSTVYATTTGDGGTDDVALSGAGRYVRVSGTQRALGYGYSLWEFQVYGEAGPTPTAPATATPGSCGAANAALGKPASASTVWAGNSAAFAVDGNSGTRWESAHSDPQWLQIDLGAARAVCRVVLNWEAAYAKAYQIQLSNDGSAWSTVYSTASGDGGIDDVAVSGTGRYLRMVGTQRALGYGYSLWEAQVYLAGATPTPTSPPTNPPTNPPTATPTQPGTWTTLWSDDFSGPANSSPAAANWLLRTGTQYPGGAANWGTGSVETASASTANVFLDGAGKLNIKAIRDGAGAWTSGRIESQRADFAAAPGEMIRFSAVLKQPDVANGLGYWPGFRATGAAYRGNFNNWPGVGETDIMANVNGRSQLLNTLHCGTAPGGPCNEYDGRSSGLATCAGCQSGFHEYAQVIDRTKSDEEIRFYLDGVQTWVVRESQVGVAAWQAAVHHGFYLRFDLAIGGSLPNAIAGRATPTADTTSGGVLSIDSVTVARSVGSAPAPLADPPIPAGPSVVRVTGGAGAWQLSVNGAPYLIKGITYGPPQAAADGYMRDIKAMGVNTIRTWGVDDANTPFLLDTAARQGIKVIVGHWLNQGADYVNDSAYKTAVKSEILARVNALKNHPGVLIWDVGNEVLLTMQDHGLPAAEVEARRVAYAQFVNELAVAIHAADPNHPVTSTDAWTGAWAYYKAHSPALDLLAVNSYGAIGGVKQAWIDGHYGKPYIITEGGPAGEWEVPNDANGVPTEPTDLQKRDGYAANWNAVLSHPGVALGATEFHYGLENDFGGVWLNTFTGGWRRLGYYALRQAYTGQPAPNTPPQITAMTVSQQTSVPAGGQFTINATVSDPDGDAIRYNLMYSDKHISGNTGFRHVTFAQTGPGAFTATAPEQLGVWKVYVYAFDGKGNVGIETRSFRVVPPTVSGVNLALGKQLTASSYQPTGPQGPLPPGNAADGSYATRWASDWSDPQWLQVDLGQIASFNHIQLAWEGAYASAYQVQVSVDGSSWTPIYATASGDGGFDSLNVSGTGRYVRVHGTARGTTYGYSLWE
ncbi:MAG TPA: discoidin domain-containing protein, partial [Herpetosiphonaceae bacterium]